MDTLLAPDAPSTSTPNGISPRDTLPKPRIKEHRACRVCGAGRLYTYLDLGVQALANALREPNAPIADELRVPLKLQACMTCKLSQLSHVVPKEWLYTTYAYRSGVSEGWRQHCASLARDYAREGALTLDIASNDGTLVREFAKRGCNAMGVEPSESFADCLYNRITGWWTPDLVRRLNLVSQVDVLTAQNVLGHVDDVRDFAAAMTLALAPNGVAIIEVPYLGDLLDSLAFDTIYHEHLSYWSVTALSTLAKTVGLHVNDVRFLRNIHGGSMRVTLSKSGGQSEAVANALTDELHDLKRNEYLRFSARVTARIQDICEELMAATPYVGYGAAAKASVLLQCMDVRAYPRVVYDENIVKHNRKIPGTNVRIEQPPTNLARMEGPLVIFAWNWADSIIARLRKAGYRGAIFVPLPRPRWDVVE
jgi:2-polyprenyl-3-methyl-5-hydroxy-6-metoxy-1,4-benzoquinol methylase